MNMVYFDVFVPKEYTRLMDEFQKNYNPLAVLRCPTVKIKHKPQRSRTCRFCGKAYQLPNVTFKKDAHIIPQFLGNRYLTNDFECDTCNHKFGAFENDLKNYLGIIPTFTKTRGSKNKLKKFEAQQKSIVAGKTNKLPIDGEFIEIFMPDSATNSFQANFEQNYVKAEFLKNPYIPYNVYKAFLKIALSSLSDNEVKNYSKALSFLSSNIHLPEIAKMYSTQTLLTETLDNPMIFIFQKCNQHDRIPKHTILLFYQNIMFQLFLPFHKDDDNLYKQGQIALPICPPLHLQKESDSIRITFEKLDFSSTEIKADDHQSLNFDFNIDLKDLYMSDPENGKMVKVLEYPKNIIGCILVPKGTIIPEDKLNQLFPSQKNNNANNPSHD